jgi:hypothetical protein
MKGCCHNRVSLSTWPSRNFSLIMSQPYIALLYMYTQYTEVVEKLISKTMPFCGVVSISYRVALTSVQLVSCPDPTLKEGKGSGEFGHNPWARERNLRDCSFSVVIWLANRRNAKCHCLLYKFESSACTRSRPWPIRSKVCFSTPVSARAHQAGQTKESVSNLTCPFMVLIQQVNLINNGGVGYFLGKHLGLPCGNH